MHRSKKIKKVYFKFLVDTTYPFRYIFFPGLSFMIFSYFGSFMVFWGWGLILGFWDWGFQLMGFGACGMGPSGFFWVGALYINLGKNGAPLPCLMKRLILYSTY